MWAQVAQPNQPTQTTPVGHETQGSSPPFLSQGEDASAKPQYTSREQQLLLQLEEARATISIYDTRLRALEEAQARAPVQERPRNDAEVDTSVDDGREPPPQAVRVNPDIRMVMSDTQGRTVEHPPDSAGGSVMSPPGDIGMLVTNASVAPTAEWSRLNMIRAPTVPAEERCDVLFQQVKNLQESMKEKDQKLRQAFRMISVVQTQLSAAKEEVEATRTQIGKLHQENGTLKQEVNMLHELQNQRENQRNQRHSLQAGVNHGRFFMSKAPMLECVKCCKMFPSQDVARNSICSYHPKAACELPNKMVDEIFAEKGRQRYWPCCGKIGTKTPLPCRHGAHALRAN